MELPVRVQRKRTKGFKLPENTVCVTRGTKWGNPFKVIGDMVYLDVSYRREMLTNGRYIGQSKDWDVVKMFEYILTIEFSHDVDINHWINHFDALDISELKGKNLACFCPLDKLCHADVLLKLANE